jgi:hypothetical protein
MLPLDCCQASWLNPMAAMLLLQPPPPPQQQQQMWKMGSCLRPLQALMGRRGVLLAQGSCCSWLQACV